MNLFSSTPIETQEGQFRRALPFLAFAVPLAVYLALPAATLNSDGLKYWKLVHDRAWAPKFLPGHLLYCPLQTLLVKGGDALLPHVSAVWWMRLVSQVSAAGSVCLVARTAKQMGLSIHGQVLSASGVACSYGVWSQAIDIETYAITLLCVAASMHAMASYSQRATLAKAAAMGLLNSLGALFHLATITLVAASVVLIVLANRFDYKRATRHVGAYLGVTLACFVIPVAAIGFGVLRLRSFGEVVAWLGSSDHGYRVAFGTGSLLRALYGIARNFLFLEFFWAAPRWLIALKGACLLLAGAWFLWQVRRGPGRLTPATRDVLSSLLGFALLQALLGIYYFGSDSERWVFLTPWFCLLIASHSSIWPGRKKAIVVVAVTIVGAVNFGQAIWPSATDHLTEERLQALAPLVTNRTLVISPGDDWLAWYAFYLPSATPPEFLTLSELAVRHEHHPEELFTELEQRIGEARHDGRKILLIRVLDAKENVKSSPWQYLASLGHPPGSFRRWFEQYPWEVLYLSDPAQTRVDLLSQSE
ncbi:MAG TPA: hypothetical protein VND64_31775 [Pirellulales bacterium]|nr:hypothetical protein [Pirellulales bacterium]